MRTSIFACLALAGVACSKDAPDLSVRLDLPLRGTELSVVVGVESDERGPVLARAWPLAEGVPFELSQAFSPSETLSITALLYERTLPELGLAEGPLETSLPSNVTGHALPAANAIYATRLIDGSVPPFEVTNQIGPLLGDVRIRDGVELECAAFETQTIGMGDTAKAHFVLGVGRGALLADDQRRVRYVTLAGPVTIAGPSEELFDAFSAESGELWIAAEGGKIFRGRLVPENCTTDAAVPCAGLETTLATRTPSREALYWISGPPTGPVDEVFTLSRTGTMEHVDLVTGAVEAHTISPANRARGGVAWVGPREGVVVFYPNVTVFRWKDAVVTTEPLGPIIVGSDTQGISAAQLVPGYGTFVGTWSGQAYRNVPGAQETWENVGVRLATDSIYAITAFESGFVIVDDLGRIAQFLPRALPSEFCEAYQVVRTTPDELTDITSVGGDIVGAGGAAAGQSQAYVRWLVRR